jgi:DNA-binding CsgD family transcriptional regulator
VTNVHTATSDFEIPQRPSWLAPARSDPAAAVDVLPKYRDKFAVEAGAKPLVEVAAEPPFLCVDEPLTGSEMRVLRYLPTQLTASEIARQLFLSVHTVTTHTRHIYAKLGVHRRHEAVDRARARGLLAPVPASHPVSDQPAPRSAASTRPIAPPPDAVGPTLPTAAVNGRRPWPAPRCLRVRAAQSATAPTGAEERPIAVTSVAAWRSRTPTCAVKFAANTRGEAQFGYPMLWVVRDTKLIMMVVR